MAAIRGPVRAVVFDLDDTLFPERQYVRSAYRAVAAHLRGTLERDEDFEGWLWNRFLAGRADKAFDSLNAAFDLGLSNDDIQRLVGLYREHRPDIRSFPGAAELLSKLHPRYRLGVLTDGYMPAQRLKLEAIRLGRFFETVVFTEELGREAWKPSGKGFEAIRKELEVQHEACAYVADNPAKDFVAPNRLGWRTVQILRPGQVHADNPPAEGGRPHTVVSLFGELYRALL